MPLDRTFTLFVETLAAGDEPTERQRGELWDKLRRSLVAELKRRGLWLHPPAFVGVIGYGSWGAGDAVEDRVADAYGFVFVDRLAALVRHSRSKPNIDGLVSLNVRHFLYERMKLHDPLGHRAYTVVHGAARAALEQGELTVVAAVGRGSGDSLAGARLAFDTNAQAVPRSRDELPASAVERVETWLDELMPDLVVTTGRGLPVVIRRLSRRLPELAENGVESFELASLVAAVKQRVRRRWQLAFRHDQGELVPETPADGESPVDWVRMVRPDSRYAERQSYHRLVECIGRRVDRLAAETAEAELPRLWTCLVTYAADGEGGLADTSDRSPPSRRQLAAFLGLPRDRVHKMLARLQQQARWCTARLARSGSPRGGGR